MKSMHSPSPFSFSTAKEFLENFCLENRTKRGLSMRSLAASLGWPASYLSDVVKDRKPFTVLRAYEYARRLKLDRAATERLILMAAVSQNPAASPAVEGILSKGLAGRKPETTIQETLTFPIALVFEAVHWLRKEATSDRIRRLLALQNISEREIENALDQMTRMKILRKVGNRFRPLVKTLHTDDLNHTSDDGLHSAMAKNLAHYFSKKKLGPATYNSSFVHLDASVVPEVANRILALRNWILELSAAESTKEAHNSRLFQLELHLLPLFDRKHVTENGLGNLQLSAPFSK